MPDLEKVTTYSEVITPPEAVGEFVASLLNDSDFGSTIRTIRINRRVEALPIVEVDIPAGDPTAEPEVIMSVKHHAAKIMEAFGPDFTG